MPGNASENPQPVGQPSRTVFGRDVSFLDGEYARRALVVTSAATVLSTAVCYSVVYLVAPELFGSFLSWVMPVVTPMLIAPILVMSSHRRQLELRRQAAELERARAEAEAANRQRARVLASVSHELRTPLNSILGFSEAMKMEVLATLPETIRDYPRIIYDSAIHLMQLIDDLLDISKIDSGSMIAKIDDDPVPVAAALDESVRFCRPLLDERRQRIVAQGCDGDAALRADPRMLRQMLTNLLSNAAKYGPADSEITVVFETLAGGGARLSVHDAGAGMSTDEIRIALSEFGQLDDGHGDAGSLKGSGLGLPLVDRLMKLHGGRLELSSGADAGTTVRLVFPPQ